MNNLYKKEKQEEVKREQALFILIEIGINVNFITEMLTKWTYNYRHEAPFGSIICFQQHIRRFESWLLHNEASRKASGKP